MLINKINFPFFLFVLWCRSNLTLVEDHRCPKKLKMAMVKDRSESQLSLLLTQGG